MTPNSHKPDARFTAPQSQNRLCANRLAGGKRYHPAGSGTTEVSIGSVRSGISLVEVLISVSILGILAAAVLTLSQPNLHERLIAVAQVVSADLDYARSLAVTHASHYSVTFDVNANRYVLTHTGSNGALDSLPASPFRQPDDAATDQTTDLGTLPTNGGVVQLAAVQRLLPMAEDVTDIEFGSLGSTTRAEPTVIWLSAGEGAATLYMSIEVDPIVGLTRMTDIQTESPTTAPVTSESPS